MNVDSLTKSFVRGAALAVTLSACGQASEPQVGNGGAGGAPDLPQKLDPIPERVYPYCVGPDYGDGPGPGFYGRCCGVIRCTPPVSDECPETNTAPVARLLPPGSGECSCSEAGAPLGVEGPFAWSALAPGTETEACCYVIYEIACDGRPLKRDGAVVVAEVVARTDWMGRGELPAWS